MPKNLVIRHSCVNKQFLKVCCCGGTVQLLLTQVLNPVTGTLMNIQNVTGSPFRNEKNDTKDAGNGPFFKNFKNIVPAKVGTSFVSSTKNGGFWHHHRRRRWLPLQWQLKQSQKVHPKIIGNNNERFK